MPYTTLTMTSTMTTSPVANLNWIGGKPISAQLIWLSSTSSSAGVLNIQYTLDDVQQVTSSAVIWTGYSSAVGQAATAFSSQSFGVNNLISFLSPVAALRLSSTTTFSSGSVLLKVLQGEGW